MRKTAFQATAVLALISSAQLQAAQTQSCLTRPELRGMIAYFLPTVLQSAIDTCASRLGPDSYMQSGAPKLLSTLESGRSEAWPMARAAFANFGSDTSKASADLFASLPEEAVRPLIESVITQKLGTTIKPENCGDVDRIMTPLEPLPAANLIDLVTETLALAGRNGKDMRVCPNS